MNWIVRIINAKMEHSNVHLDIVLLPTSGAMAIGKETMNCKLGFFVLNSIFFYKRDCRDMSDEVNCPARFPGGRYCPESRFQCANHLCVGMSDLCDGKCHFDSLGSALILFAMFISLLWWSSVSLIYRLKINTTFLTFLIFDSMLLHNQQEVDFWIDVYWKIRAASFSWEREWNTHSHTFRYVVWVCLNRRFNSWDIKMINKHI